EDVVIVLFDVVRLVFVDEVLLGFHRRFGIEVGGQQMVFHIDPFQPFLRRGLVLGYDAGNVVADVADFLNRKRVLIVANRKDAVRVGGVSSGDNGDDAVKLFGAAGVDALDAGVGMRRVQNSANQHAGEKEVVGIFARTGGLGGGVDHGDGSADDGK